MAYIVNEMDTRKVGPVRLSLITGIRFLWKDKLRNGVVYKMDWVANHAHAMRMAEEIRKTFSPLYWTVKVKPYRHHWYGTGYGWRVSVVSK